MQDSRHARLRLFKGKLTIRPESHTGEGIFYSAWMFDRFSMISESLFYRRSRRGRSIQHGSPQRESPQTEHSSGNWLVELEDLSDVSGTTVFMEIHPKSPLDCSGRV